MLLQTANRVQRNETVEGLDVLATLRDIIGEGLRGRTTGSFAVSVHDVEDYIQVTVGNRTFSVVAFQGAPVASKMNVERDPLERFSDDLPEFEDEFEYIPDNLLVPTSVHRICGDWSDRDVIVTHVAVSHPVLLSDD